MPKKGFEPIMDLEKCLHIALIGTRGVPANYGGFETCVEEIGKRLVKKGHRVTVYCRKSYYPDRADRYLGMELVHLPNVSNKSLDTMSHTFLSILHAAIRKFDIYMVFNAGNSPFLFPLRLFGANVVLNTDGLEWKRSKWGAFGRFYYKLAERISCMMANRLISDSQGIRQYYLNRYNTESTEIAYGAYIQNSDGAYRLQDFNLEPKKYFLQVTRFEPENNPLLTVRAFKRLHTNKKLVLIGGNPYPSDYTRKIYQESNDSILLPGFIYNQKILKDLWCNCYAYIHGNSVGGTNPALLQAMASGCFTIAIDNPFNRNVLSDCGFYYSENEDSLAETMRWSLDNGKELDNYRRKAQNRIAINYTWERITDQYEKLFADVYLGKYPWRFNGQQNKIKTLPSK